MTAFIIDNVVMHNGIGYVAIQNHTSGPTNEPGIEDKINGVPVSNWREYWRLQEWHFPGEQIVQETVDAAMIVGAGMVSGIDTREYPEDAATIVSIGDPLGADNFLWSDEEILSAVGDVSGIDNIRHDDQAVISGDGDVSADEVFEDA